VVRDRFTLDCFAAVRVWQDRILASGVVGRASSLLHVRVIRVFPGPYVTRKATPAPSFPTVPFRFARESVLRSQVDISPCRRYSDGVTPMCR
jgi:hypothetical protein